MNAPETASRFSSETEKNALLASVSRSFYLTIRILPAPLRQPIRTAYLLARAADTIADAAAIPVDERLKSLRLLAGCILEGSDGEDLILNSMQIAARQSSEAEKILLSQLPEVLEDYLTLATADRDDVRTVLGHITHGQERDLLTFADPKIPCALPSAAALEEYTFLVAGSVGEFWTHLCGRKLPAFAVLPMSEMMELGRDFGKGLQLVNILRDLHADLDNRRCYLPVEPENFWDNPRNETVYGEWLQRASALLSAGWSYVLALRHWRLRFACALPILMGKRTLTLLREKTPWQTNERIKISRSEVRGMLLQCVCRAHSDRLLDAYYRRLS